MSKKSPLQAAPSTGTVPTGTLGDRPFSIRPRPVYPRQLDRDDLLDLLSRLEVLDSILFTISSEPASINTEGDFFAGVASIAEDVTKDVRHMIDEDVEFDRAQGSAR